MLAFAVSSRESDREVHEGDVDWWLEQQERIEIRTDFASRGLL